MQLHLFKVYCPCVFSLEFNKILIQQNFKQIHVTSSSVIKTEVFRWLEYSLNTDGIYDVRKFWCRTSKAFKMVTMIPLGLVRNVSNVRELCDVNILFSCLCQGQGIMWRQFSICLSTSGPVVSSTGRVDDPSETHQGLG